MEQPEIKKLYYDAVKFYQLPVVNHRVLAMKILALEREIGYDHARKYLTSLMKRDLRTEDFEFKPILNSGLDIYMKRIKVEAYYEKNNPRQTYILPSPEEAEAAEAKRRNQWDK